MGPREDLIEAITQRVLAQLEAPGDRCADCTGCCAAHCSDKVRAMVEEGAERVSFNGNGAEVPTDLATFIDHTKLGPDVTAEVLVSRSAPMPPRSKPRRPAGRCATARARSTW